METTPQVKKNGRRVARGCLIIIVAFILLGLAGYFYMRAPHFSGSEISTIEIEMFSPDFTLDRKPLLQASITDPSASASVFELLRMARFRMDHKCGDIGSFKIQYLNGKTDVLDFLPGHDPAGYEFRLNGWLYRLPRDLFYKAMRDAGVDTTKIPESEH